MSNEVAKAENHALSMAEELKGRLRRTRSQIPDVSGSQYLRFLQDGSWVFGADNEEVADDDLIAVNPLSIRVGWTCWTDHKGGKKNECMGEDMVPLGQDVTPKNELPDHGWPWREQVAVMMAFTNGPHKGKQVEYKTNSVGGLRAVNAMIDQIMLQLDEDPTHVVPVVALEGSHYNHKVYGRTYTPEISIKDWITLDGEKKLLEEAEEEGTEEEEKKPARKKAAKKKPEPEVEIEDEIEEEEEDIEAEDEEEEEEEETKPVRRRRRRAA